MIISSLFWELELGSEGAKRGGIAKRAQRGSGVKVPTAAVTSRLLLTSS